MAPARNRSLAIVACCAFSGNVLGQSLPPLQVDPALLGLPPAKPVPPALPPVAPAPAAAAVPAPAAIAPAPAAVTPAPAPAAPVAAPLAPAPAIEAPAKPAAREARTAKAAPKPKPGPRRDKLPATEAAESPGSGLQAPTPATPAAVGGALPALAPREERRERRDAAEPTTARPQPTPPQLLRPEEWDQAGLDAVPAPALRLSARLAELAPGSDEARPVFVSADRIDGINDQETVADGQVELRKIGTVVDADRLTYRHVDDEVEAEGKVRLTRDASVVSGPRLRLRLEEQVGFIDQPEYELRRVPPANAPAAATRKTTQAHGQASKIEFQGENQFQLSNASFSTCKPGDDSWFARVADLHLDYDREVGEGSDGTVVFKGVPIFYSPWLSFSLNNNRKSGFLPPTFGSTSQSGSEFTLPYYWNIAPNMDATLAPRLYTKRGTQLNTEFRYLDPKYNGEARVEWLPGDRVRDFDRWGYSLQHTHNFGYGLSGSYNLNGVSDDFYYSDLSSRIANASQTQLVRQGNLAWTGTGWSLGAQVTRYQTLQTDQANLVARPYEITPQLTLGAHRNLFDLVDASVMGQYTWFTHPDQDRVEGRRAVLYPKLSLPLVTPSFYLTPKLGLHATQYSFDRQAPGAPTSFSRNVPIASIDSGVTFERPLTLLGNNYTQTLEPRLYYLWVPNRDQSVLTNNGINFDSGVADFNFAQIFSENVFTGQDRIADANQLTLAVSSRFLDPGSGAEYFKAMVGQRLYFSTQSVTLNAADARRVARKTDLLAAATGQVAPFTHIDAAWQYNPRDSRTERLNLGGRFQPEVGRVLNAAYRFGRSQTAPFDVSVKQIDVSGQWPLFGGWQAVGRYNYSINEKRIIETIGGLEYNSGCWAARVVVQRFATTATNSSSSLFFQLELSDFSRIGSNPLELLKRSIPGYGQVDQPAADPVFGSQ